MNFFRASSTSRTLLTLAALSLAAMRAAAHDFWIEPSTFQVAPLGRVAVDLRVGELFVHESVARNPAKIARFCAIDPAGKESALVGLDGGTPAGWLVPREAGLHVLAYRSRNVAIELEAAKFEHYLAAEGLETVIAERARRGESAAKGRERYSRSVKSFVRCGDASSELSGFDRRLGLTLELVPLAHPLTLKVGDELPLDLEYEGKPLSGALVGCMPKVAPDAEVRVRSDEKGRVRFKVQKSGTHMVRVVHMVRVPEGGDADWESVWSSITFSVESP